MAAGRAGEGLVMITGYNTDIRHRGVVFHVQTEDKGVNNPCVESLVYVGGQIVGRRRTGYQTMLSEGRGKEEVLQLLETQHREMIGEIGAGSLDAEVERRVGPLGPATTAPAQPTLQPGTAVEEPPPPTRDAPAPPPRDETSSTPSLDQVILDYLSSEAEQEHLVVSMDASDDLKLGEQVRLVFRTETSSSKTPIADAAVAVRLISTTSEPATLGNGSTDESGNLSLLIDIPSLPKGSAALIVTATSDIGTAEIKHLL